MLKNCMLSTQMQNFRSDINFGVFMAIYSEKRMMSFFDLQCLAVLHIGTACL